MFKRLVLVDLDGVINTYTGNYQKDYIPQMKDGADLFLQNIIDTLDCDIKIFTTRPYDLAKKWIKENNLEKYVKDVTNIKEPAYLIIDDRCIRYINFEQTMRDILIFKEEKRKKI